MEPPTIPSQDSTADLSIPVGARRTSSHIYRKTSWGTPIPPPSAAKPTSTETNLLEVDLNFRASSGSNSAVPWNTLDNIAALGLAFNGDSPHAGESPILARFSLDDLGCTEYSPLPTESEIPFTKWVKTIHRRAGQRRKTVSCGTHDSTSRRDYLDSPATCRKSEHHKKSSSSSSFGFVTAIKSASISLASMSIAPRSRRTANSSHQQKTDHSSNTSHAARLSEDSVYHDRGAVIDQAVTNRLLQRRRVLEEIISTEESYLADVKFLMNVYVTFLASIPGLSLSLRASINRNLNEIVELHEGILGDLHCVVPHSEYTQLDCKSSTLCPPVSGHNRWKSIDAVPENAGGPAWLQKVPGMTAEPQIAAKVAHVFGRKMSRFFVYEEYGAKYEMMIKDVASTYRTIPQWETYQKGLEALASSLGSINHQQIDSKKSLTIGDLLVKPIQRVCKYPLLFGELLRQTPVCDCPDSHMAIENVLIRLREATTEINRATDDPRMKVVIEKSWLLQDRLVFQDRPESRSRNTIRSLGRIHLCGVLHISWQTLDGADGQYLISLLYRDFLILASSSKGDQTYTIRACVALHELRVEEVDNGRGLQCHTVSFSWKVVFECDHQLFEITMSACSPKEELEWRSRLTDHSSRESLDAGEQAILTSLSIPVKSMGTVFGKPGTVARRLSIHRATTVGPMSGLCHVIIKNTNAFKETASSSNINRSQSLLSTNRIPIIASARADRMRLESLLADVWTRDILPYPGMSGRVRSEHLVRASASSMMRKLSVASITSNFTKRSGSIASLQKMTDDDQSIERDITRTNSPHRTEPNPNDASPSLCPDDMNTSRLSIIQDEKENFRTSSFDTLPGIRNVSNGSPASTLRRTATSTVKKGWAHDGQRIITPPLRTSSANSFGRENLIRVATIANVPEMLVEEKEGFNQVQTLLTPPKPGKRTNPFSKSSRMVPEGIRSFFR
ncbi:RhoGEF domain-containing protein [Amylocarpus encephaloides]|uniref:RhoGEF domain-containing protein n=1 Tax=Amylocarpus encephaloides TaxID=45428 RepID=A0A9P7YTF9_9HELO|nr:RhoGEF domain-containing protein [Amylocarpus encephaloides]